MTTTLPPAPPHSPPADDLEALIKEARRRARRRRALYALSALLAAGAAVAGFAGFHGSGGHAHPRVATKPAAPPPPQAQHTATGLSRNGPLAIIDGADSARIVVVGLRGRLVRSLPICRDPKCGGVTSVAWSPDGKTLAYGTASGANWHPQDGLHLFDAARNKDRRIDAGNGNWQGLAWSPDGTRLAYVNAASVYVLRLAHPARRPVLVRGAATSPSWSPNGRLIAYDRCTGGRTSGIEVARPDGSQLRHIRRFGCAPAWSPDGSRIAYLTRCGIRLRTTAGQDITPGSVWRCTHIGAGGSPVWSPDGRKIAASGAGGVYVMNADGSGLRMVWEGPSGIPSWRPLRR
jgi:dipeptidyl aminopeptidase/acylaminoacyl peptidase